jgi:orotate phosphoribosyltransferase
MSDLTEMLLDCGLLQFGQFAGQGRWEPYRLNFQWLPSYPDVLHRMADACTPLIGEVDHILSTLSSLPLGMAVSLRSGIPLVYSRETDEAAVYDLVGAYDIGHPAVLIAHSSHDVLYALPLVERASRVGLEVRHTLVILDEGTATPDGLPLRALLHLPAVVEQMAEAGRLPENQAQIVKHWVNSHRSG